MQCGRAKAFYRVHSEAMTTVAYFVSPHGFGHAARACAVIEALAHRQPSLRFHIFSTVPEWFFAESLPFGFEYHPCHTDVGLVQLSPLEEDIAATLRALDEAPWRDSKEVEKMARQLGLLGCGIVLADISPLGLCVARCARLPSVVVENFTWDWIYNHIEGSPELGVYGDELASLFAQADLRIQTRPACQPLATAIQVGPVARSPRRSRAETRRRLEVPEDSPMVLASMGGLGWDYPALEHMVGGDGPWIVVPGGAEVERRRERLLLLPFHSSFFHPDLVHAADVVVGKLGYSTVAEVCQAGAALAYVERPRFPESPVLARFVDENVTSVVLGKAAFESGAWRSAVHEVLGAGRKAPCGADGAAETAAAVFERFPEIFR